MERDTTINTISIRQLGTLLVLALLPLGTEVLPSRLSQAGGAAWPVSYTHLTLPTKA